MAYAPLDLGTVSAGQGGFVIRGEDSGDAFGHAVASAGDINGDGFGDLIIGAPGADGAGNAKPFLGASYVLFGQAEAFAATIDLGAIAAGQGGFVIHGEDIFDAAGSAVASAGDVNGDGFDDLFVGAPYAEGEGRGSLSVGAGYVVFGKAGGFGAAIGLGAIARGKGGFAILGEDRYDLAGASLASAGDLNRDGFDDLVIGAHDSGGPHTANYLAGASYVVFGQAGGFNAPIDLSSIAAGVGGFAVYGMNAGDRLGASVASAGDINADGFDDLIIGAPGFGEGIGKPGLGASYVVFGQAGSFGATITLSDIASGQGGFVIHGEDRFDVAGDAVASAGDVNGDGFGDLIIGAGGVDGEGDAEPGSGAAYVVYGKDGGVRDPIDLTAIAAGLGGFVLYGENKFDVAGTSVASAGDLNGDGFDDLLIGAPRADPGGHARSDAGASYVLFGTSGNAGAAISLGAIARGQGGFIIQGEDPDDWSGRSVASAGDINGDGFDDLVIGASDADGAGNAKDGAGDSYVVFGGAFQPGPEGTAGADSLAGSELAEGLQGLGGNDNIRGKQGKDTLTGGGGDDVLKGGRDADVLSGGEGADGFQFGAHALGAIDRILDFDAFEGDRIVLRGIDAIAATQEDDRFTVISTAAFSGTAGELRWQDRGRGVQRIEGDVDGDGAADLIIDIANDAAPIEAAWFVL